MDRGMGPKCALEWGWLTDHRSPLELDMTGRAAGFVLLASLLSASAFRPQLTPQHRSGLPPAATSKVLSIRGGGATAMSLSQAFSVYAPAMGILTSNALYFSALPEVLRSRRVGDLGAFNPLPSTIMVLSVLSWLQYSLVVGNPWILASNLPGAAAVLLTFAVMLPLMGNDHKALDACQCTFVGGAMATLCLWTYLIFGGVASAVRAKLVGYFASAIFVALAASPLSTIRTVVTTRDSASIYTPLTLAQCANTLLWTVYGLMAAKDVFVYGPNAVGLSLGVAQLVLKALFPSSAAGKAAR